MIKKVENKYVLYSKSKKGGHRRRLGTFSSRGAAMKREKQIQYFKHLHEEAAGNVSASVTGAAVRAPVNSVAVYKKSHGDRKKAKQKVSNSIFVAYEE